MGYYGYYYGYLLFTYHIHMLYIWQIYIYITYTYIYTVTYIYIYIYIYMYIDRYHFISIYYIIDDINIWDNIESLMIVWDIYGIIFFLYYGNLLVLSMGYLLYLWVVYYIRDNIWKRLTIEGTTYHGLWIIHADSHCMMYIYICAYISMYPWDTLKTHLNYSIGMTG